MTGFEQYFNNVVKYYKDKDDKYSTEIKTNVATNGCFETASALFSYFNNLPNEKLEFPKIYRMDEKLYRCFGKSSLEKMDLDEDNKNTFRDLATEETTFYYCTSSHYGDYDLKNTKMNHAYVLKIGKYHLEFFESFQDAYDVRTFKSGGKESVLQNEKSGFDVFDYCKQNIMGGIRFNLDVQAEKIATDMNNCLKINLQHVEYTTVEPKTLFLDKAQCYRIKDKNSHECETIYDSVNKK
jgi:hypothetical protein